MWLSRQIKIVMQQDSTYHDTHSTDESQNHCCNIGRKSCNRQNWYIATESKWMVASGRERMDSREHTGPVGGWLCPVSWHLPRAMELSTHYQCISLHANYPSVLLTWKKIGGKAGGHLLFLFYILLHCLRFDSEHLSLLQQNTPPGRNEAKEGETAVSISGRGFEGGPWSCVRRRALIPR